MKMRRGQARERQRVEQEKLDRERGEQERQRAEELRLERERQEQERQRAEQARLDRESQEQERQRAERIPPDQEPSVQEHPEQLRQSSVRPPQKWVRRKWRILCVGISVSCLAFYSGGTLFVSGTVTDEGINPIAGCHVFLTDQEIGFEESGMTTDSEGQYRLLLNPWKTYRLDFEASGYKRTIRRNLRVNGLWISVDPRMQRGDSADFVELNLD